MLRTRKKLRAIIYPFLIGTVIASLLLGGICGIIADKMSFQTMLDTENAFMTGMDLDTENIIRLFFQDYSFTAAAAAFIIIMIAGIALLGKIDKQTKFVDPTGSTRTFSTTENYGKARFESPDQYRPLAQIRPIEDCHGKIYGMLDQDGRACVDCFPDPKDKTTHINQHIFAIGASGSGKSFTVGKTYCYQAIKCGHSIVHTDPKGELYDDMANIYRNHGYIVRRLNFNDPEHSDGWDCMKSIRDEKNAVTVELLAERFSTAVVTQITGGDTSSIYYTGPQALLKALVLRLVLDDSIQPERKNLKTVYEWLTNTQGIDFLDVLFESESMPMKLQACLAPWITFKNTSPNLQSNLLANLRSGVSVLSNQIIREMLSTDDMDILALGTTPCAYFIQFPVPNDTFRFPVALFFTMLFEALQNYATAQNNRKLPREVDFFLDEFAQCGVFPGWDQRMSVIRSYGLNVFMVVQTIAQFKKNYKDSDQTIISNCATWLMLGCNDQDSAKMFSARLGQTTIQVESESREGLRRFLGIKNSPTDRVSSGTGKTDLMAVDEIMKLQPNTLLILFQRHDPIWANAVPHTMHPYAKDGKPVDKAKEPYFYDEMNTAQGLPTREQRFNAEKEFIENYWETHSTPAKPDNINDTLYGGTLLHDCMLVVFDDLRAWIHKSKDKAAVISEKGPEIKPVDKSLEKTKTDDITGVLFFEIDNEEENNKKSSKIDFGFDDEEPEDDISAAATSDMNVPAVPDKGKMPVQNKQRDDNPQQVIEESDSLNNPFQRRRTQRQTPNIPVKIAPSADGTTANNPIPSSPVTAGPPHKKRM